MITKFSLTPLLLFLLIISSCTNKKQNREKTLLPTKTTDTEKVTDKLSFPKENTPLIARKIANANGIQNWNKVEEISFTFNVYRNYKYFKRSWTWKPKTGDVHFKNGNKKTTYNRNHLDSTNIQTDRSFINDKYWLLAPFNLIWDKGLSFKYHGPDTAPISKDTLQKLSILYDNEVGYTPGDAYDLYYDNNLLIKEWVFRKSNQETPSMITTWEDYDDYNGIKIAKKHQNEKKDVKIFFTDIDIKLVSDIKKPTSTP